MKDIELFTSKLDSYPSIRMMEFTLAGSDREAAEIILLQNSGPAKSWDRPTIWWSLGADNKINGASIQTAIRFEGALAEALRIARIWGGPPFMDARSIDGDLTIAEWASDYGMFRHYNVPGISFDDCDHALTVSTYRDKLSVKLAKPTMRIVDSERITAHVDSLTVAQSLLDQLRFAIGDMIDWSRGKRAKVEYADVY